MRRMIDAMARILLVDDDPIFRAGAAAALGLAGHVVDEARDGRQAVAIFRAEPPDLVISDLVMPDSEGVQLIMMLRRESATVKIIAITGGAHPTVYLRMASLLGANYSLAKPFTYTLLLQTVEKALGGEP